MEKNYGRKYIPHYTVKDWEKWEGNWELIDGTAYAMSPSPSRIHQYINGNVVDLLRKQLHLCKKCIILSESDFKIANDTVVRPDTMIVCGDKKSILNDNSNITPVLIIEVQSESTAKNDRENKYYLYEDAGVKYYAMLDTDKKLIEIFELKNKKYELVYQGIGDVLPLQIENCVFTADWKEIWE